MKKITIFIQLVILSITVSNAQIFRWPVLNLDPKFANVSVYTPRGTTVAAKFLLSAELTAQEKLDMI